MILSLSVSVLTGCGSKEILENEKPAKIETESFSESDIVQDNANITESTEEIVTDTKTDINLFGAKIEPIAEEDAVVNIDGVEVKMMQTWEEFQQFLTDNGWTMEEPEDFLHDDKLVGSGYVNTHCG